MYVFDWSCSLCVRVCVGWAATHSLTAWLKGEAILLGEVFVVPTITNTVCEIKDHKHRVFILKSRLLVVLCLSENYNIVLPLWFVYTVVSSFIHNLFSLSSDHCRFTFCNHSHSFDYCSSSACLGTTIALDIRKHFVLSNRQVLQVPHVPQVLRSQVQVVWPLWQPHGPPSILVPLRAPVCEIWLFGALSKKTQCASHVQKWYYKCIAHSQRLTCLYLFAALSF